jgi:flagellum-specific peptidoglycan hydrolase FlgJ
MTKTEFLQLATEAAKASSAASGLPAGVAVAQAALESAWGSSRLSETANNYFGIKAARGQSSIALATMESINGEMRKITARFVRYASIAESFAARDRIIISAPCYAEARGHAREPIAFIHSLAKFWATDPAYAEKLEHIYLQNNFAALDRSSSCQPEELAKKDPFFYPSCGPAVSVK